MLYYKIYIVYRDLITTLIIGVLHFIIMPISTFCEALLVRYGNASLRLFFYKIYMVYRDLITTLIIGVLHFIITPISTFIGTFVRHSNPCLRLFVVILQDLRCLQRFYHNVDHCSIELLYKISHLADLSLVRYRIVCPPLIIHGLRLFLFILLYQVSCLDVLPLVSYACGRR